MNAPVVIGFVAGSTLQRESDRRSDFPIVRNGPPGTFVLLPAQAGSHNMRSGVRVSLPTDQIVSIDESHASVRVGFGGFQFDGLRDGRLTFTRVRELRPEHELSPDRSFTMTLDPAWVDAIEVDGRPVWP